MVVVWCVEAVGILNVRKEWGGGMLFPIPPARGGGVGNIF